MLEQTVSIEKYAIMGAGVFIILALLLIVIVTALAKKRKIRKAKKAEKKQATAMQKQAKAMKKQTKKMKKQNKAADKKKAVEEVEEVQEEESVQYVTDDIKVVPEESCDQKAAQLQQAENYEEDSHREKVKMPSQVQSTSPEVEQESKGPRLELMSLGDVEKKETLVVPFLEQVRIGRIKERNDLVIKSDLTVSSKHCKVYRQEGIIYIIDLNSTNGTRVNGKLIHHPEPLVSGDEVHIGQIAYKVIIH